MITIPRIGLGTWKSNDNAVLINAIKEAIKAGYRHIDCAAIYGNEQAVGQAIEEAIQSGIVKRSDLWITSKLWSNCHDPSFVEAACKKTLKDLKLDYLDLYLIHNPIAFHEEAGQQVLEQVSIIDTWKAMEDLFKQGYVRHIGVSNFNIELLERMRYCPDISIQPYCNQVECHLYMQQGAMIDYLQKRGIYMTAYAPLGSSDSDKTGSRPCALKDPVVLDIAQQIGKTPAQVILKFILTLSPIIQVIPKSVTPSRIAENRALDFELTPEQVNRLKKCERCLRYLCLKDGFMGQDFFGDQF